MKNCLQNIIVFSKKSSTFAELLKSSAIEASFGEMAEWSIAAVLKTVELRGSGGSNPSLSAERSEQNQALIVKNLQVIDL